MKLRVKIDGSFYEVEVDNINARPVIARVDGEVFEVYPEETANEARPVSAAPAPKPTAPPCPPKVSTSPAKTASTPGGKAVPAPIPGVILSISVKVGEEVTPGQELCVLEAMKMNNSIRATRDGKIAAIHITPGDHVTHNQLLMEFND